MSKYTEGALVLDRMAVQFKALVDLADVLRAAGSAEQAADEANARRDAAVAEEQSAKLALAAALADVANANTEAKDARKATAEKALKAEAKAQADAEAVIADAHTKAETLTQDASLQAQSILAALQVEQASAQQAIAALRTEVSQLIAKRDGAQAELDALQKQVEDIRARVLGALVVKG